MAGGKFSDIRSGIGKILKVWKGNFGIPAYFKRNF